MIYPHLSVYVDNNRDLVSTAVVPGHIFVNVRRISIEPEILRCYWLLVVYF